ncbi:NAD(P)/FAD-dependent oxidoreductase [Anaerolentibacter hominis]|uniref:NAD(P)/FAD-dependent oxidoreductase n=1 Tax=Anaerolentibacter hominis TaxID=3079009 RepID=UPI0031B858E2
MFDVLVIGAGVIGCAIARELSAYQLHIGVLEKEEDVCCGTSKANSGIVHGGYDALPGSDKARFNIEGSRMMEQLAKDLDVPYRRNGSLVVCFHEEDRGKLEELMEQGVQNGVEDLRIIEREEIRKMEPNLSETIVAALYVPSGAIICPFGLTIALGENAAENGAEFMFQESVTGIEKKEGYFAVHTATGSYKTRTVVNAAGVYADQIHSMVCENSFSIVARKGEYCLFDKVTGGFVDHTIFQLPSEMGKGVLVTPTVHGNLMVGPNANDMPDKEENNTTAKGLEEILTKASLTAERIPARSVITSFAGLRAHNRTTEDFIVGEAEDVPGFFDAAGIESPGLSASPAIGVYIAGLVAGKLKAEKKENYKKTRKGIIPFAELSEEEKAEAIRRNPAYGTVICRCETVTEAEIVDAIRRPLGARSLDGIKRRTRAGMGRCQSGFCMPKVTEILKRELGYDYDRITKSGPGSEILYHKNKQND